MALDLPEPSEPGIWPDSWLVKAVESGIVEAPHFSESQLQPASVDLTLGDTAFRLRCSFLPGKNDTVENQMRSFVVGPPIPLEEGAILERNRPYLIQLRESVNLPARVRARANPKSSTGRLDVFTRVITDRSGKFDDIRAGYKGPLYLEVVPRSFAVNGTNRPRAARPISGCHEGRDARLRLGDPCRAPRRRSDPAPRWTGDGPSRQTWLHTEASG